MRNEVLKFAEKFKEIDWNNGNCFYFATMLAARFGGEVAYNVIDGHFCTLIDGNYYDSLGLCPYSVGDERTILWKDFAQYDSLQMKRIERDVILDI